MTRSTRGAVLLMVVVCLFVISLVAFSLTRSIVTHHRQSIRQRNELQAMWLAESALARAQGQIAKSEDYAGEVWKIAAEELGGHETCSASIRIENVDGDESSKRIIVEARFPDHPTRGVLHKRVLTIPTKPSGSDEGESS